MKKYIYFTILISLIAISASYFASAHPDGLEFVAEKLGFISVATERTSIMTNYTVPFLGETAFSTAASGIVGVFLCFGLFYGLRKLFLSRNHI